MKIKGKVISKLLLILCVFLLAGCGSGSMQIPQRETSIDCSYGFMAAPSKSDMVEISENDRFVLYADLSRGEAAVKDKRSGEIWYTNPEDKSEDGLASGFHKNALQSAITVVYSTSLSVEMSCGGFMSSVRKDGLSYRLEEDGSVIFMFDFPNEEFAIPVRYAIDEDFFVAEILTESIVEYGTNTIKTIDLLPFFGAGGVKDEGYLFVPDGSGALIYYNNNRLTANTYSQAVYGFDNGTTDKLAGGKSGMSSLTVSENQYLPIFGAKKNDSGFLAIIAGGAARATINANVAYKYTLYNSVWSTCQFRSIGIVSQTQKDGSENVAAIAEKKTERWQDYRVEYYFFANKDGGYPEMASLYRDYLVRNRGLTGKIAQEQDIPLYLDMYGYIEKTKSFLGIPMEKKIPMTTIEDAEKLLDELAEDNVHRVILKYNFWAKDSYFDKLPLTAKPDGKIGNARQLTALRDKLAENGGGLYLSADLLNVYKSGRGINEYADALRSVANTTQRQYEFSPATGGIDTRYGAWYLLRPASIAAAVESFAAKLSEAGFTTMALDSVGTKLYSELGSSGVGRNQMRQLMSDILENLARQTEGLMVSGANEYAAVNATHILQTPAKDSGYDLVDVSIPFYQMVFHGYASYGLGAANLSSNPADMTLKCLEFGACPVYSLISRNGDELIGSRMDRLFSPNASDWQTYIAEQYEQLNEALREVQSDLMTDHGILSEYVRTTTYESGTSIYVNYDSKGAYVDGIELEPKGFAVVKNGTVVAGGRAVGSAEGGH